MSRSRLTRGDLLPEVRTEIPGPESRAACTLLRQNEAPGINTLYRDRDTLVWDEALGANVLDLDGNRFLDFTSGFGVAALGHRPAEVVAAVQRQSQKLLHGLGDVAAHPTRVELAEQLLDLVPVDDPQVYFAVSGADAVEVAIKTARMSTGRRDLLVFDPSYHGLTLGALAATSRPEFRDPFSEHLDRHRIRRPFGVDLEVLARDFAERSEGRQFAAALFEPIVGREGVLVPPEGWMRDLSELCRRHGVLLIADEIFTGFGRTGMRFAVDHESVRPDLLCCGKALGGGLPIAAVVGRRDVLASWRSPGEARHTGTFVAHPLACAAALASLRVLEDRDLAARARQLGARIVERSGSWVRWPWVSEVRGRGLLHGVELDHPDNAGRLMEGCWRRGLLVLAGGARGRVAQIVPPLTVSEAQLDHGLDLFESVLGSLEPQDSEPNGIQQDRTTEVPARR